MAKRNLPTSLHPDEVTWGIRYLLFELFFLGSLLWSFLPIMFPGLPGTYIHLIYFTINFASVLWIFRRFLLESFRSTAGRWLKMLIAVAAGLTVYFASMELVNLLTRQLMPGFINDNDQSILQNMNTDRVLTVFATVVLVPLTEEVLHRGLVFGLLHGKNRLLAYGLSALIFSFIHISGAVYSDPTRLLLTIVQYLPAGLILARAYEFSGSIFTPVIIHSIINLVATVLLR